VAAPEGIIERVSAKEVAQVTVGLQVLANPLIGQASVYIGGNVRTGAGSGFWGHSVTVTLIFLDPLQQPEPTCTGLKTIASGLQVVEVEHVVVGSPAIGDLGQ
jgi:hypothetical protein